MSIIILNFIVRVDILWVEDELHKLAPNRFLLHSTIIHTVIVGDTPPRTAESRQVNNAAFKIKVYM